MLNVKIGKKHLSEITADAITVNGLRNILFEFVHNKTLFMEQSGFVYNSVTFPLTTDDKVNFITLLVASDMLSYPFNLTGTDGFIVLESAGEIAAFAGALIGNVFSNKIAEQTIRTELTDAETIDDLKLVEDNR